MITRSRGLASGLFLVFVGLAVIGRVAYGGLSSGLLDRIRETSPTVRDEPSTVATTPAKQPRPIPVPNAIPPGMV